MNNTEQWVKLRFSIWYWLTSIGNVFKTCHDAAGNEANGKIKERRRSGKINTVAHEVFGPGNQPNVAANGSEGDGTGQASNRNLKIALQAMAFQLAWDIVMAHLVPGYMMQRAITIAEGFTTNPLVFVYFFDNKYFKQPGGQVHLWDPPEFAIKKSATWDPSVEGFATFFARMTIIWENYQQAKRDVTNDDSYTFSAFDKFQHLRNIIKETGTLCKRMVFHQQLREFLKEHPDLTVLTEDDLEGFEITCSSEEQDQRNTNNLPQLRQPSASSTDLLPDTNTGPFAGAASAGEVDVGANDACFNFDLPPGEPSIPSKSRRNSRNSANGTDVHPTGKSVSFGEVDTRKSDDRKPKPKASDIPVRKQWNRNIPKIAADFIRLLFVCIHTGDPRYKSRPVPKKVPKKPTRIFLLLLS